MKSFHVLAILGLSFFLLISCKTQKQTSEYWVNTHASEIQTMSYDEWLLLPDSIRFESRLLLSIEQMKDFWAQKIERFLALPWTTEERIHIDKAVQFYNDNIDDMLDVKIRSSQEVSEKVENFMTPWFMEGMEKFGWGKQVGYAMFMTLDPMLDKQGTLYHKIE